MYSMYRLQATLMYSLHNSSKDVGKYPHYNRKGRRNRLKVCSQGTRSVHSATNKTQNVVVFLLMVCFCCYSLSTLLHRGGFLAIQHCSYTPNPTDWQTFCKNTNVCVSTLHAMISIYAQVTHKYSILMSFCICLFCRSLSCLLYTSRCV